MSARTMRLINYIAYNYIDLPLCSETLKEGGHMEDLIIAERIILE
jgi:hypothetical protein